MELSAGERLGTRSVRVGLAVVAVAGLVAGVVFLGGGRSATKQGSAGAGDTSEPAAAPADLARSQGVTDTTIKLGFIVNEGGDEVYAGFANAAGNTKNFSYGDEKKQVMALVEDLNRRGGIAGRTVTPVFSTIRVPNFEGDYARICTQLTEDQKVFAALAGETIGVNPTLTTCFAQHRTLLLTTPLVGGEEAAMREASPWHQMPFTKTDSATWRALVPEMQRQGFFGSEARVGLVVADNPAMAKVADEVVKPALAKIKVPVVDELRGHAGDAGAVLRFKQNRVSHVLFIPSWEAASYFMLIAEAQQFRPRYGLESGFAPEFQRVLVPPVQFRGSMGIGWRPQFDVADGQDKPYRPQEERCFDLMRGAGIAVKTRFDPFPALIHCDTLWLFEAAAAKAGRNLTSGSWLAGLKSLGTSWPSALTFKVDLSRGGAGGSSAHRVLAFDDACNCFTYRGEVVPDAT